MERKRVELYISKIPYIDSSVSDIHENYNRIYFASLHGKVAQLSQKKFTVISDIVNTVGIV